ncbi:HtaA domain-containing protein [Paenarthrobacter sp.]|uniref:HtaA domain-containing protein n=1 Tax=Paenarthrobacter sp. TaxID=1931993 RepID=UPI0028126F82|nr:HtaA domain-containing protein [Paenarthrobacter sp.]
MKKLRRAPAGTHSLQWRIDPAFDDYVRNRTGDGTVTLSAGATRDDDGYYHFPRTVALGDHETLRFGGSVEFRAYLGVLSLRIAEPSLHVADGVVHLYIADDSSPAGTRLELATANIEPGATGSMLLDLRLTERGAELFLGKYPAGTSLAPLDIVLGAPAARALSVEGAF